MICTGIGCGSEALETKRQKRAPVPVGKIPEVADANETLREEVKEEATVARPASLAQSMRTDARRATA